MENIDKGGKYESIKEDTKGLSEEEVKGRYAETWRDSSNELDKLQNLCHFLIKYGIPEDSADKIYEAIESAKTELSKNKPKDSDSYR